MAAEYGMIYDTKSIKRQLLEQNQAYDRSMSWKSAFFQNDLTAMRNQAALNPTFTDLANQAYAAYQDNRNVISGMGLTEHGAGKLMTENEDILSQAYDKYMSDFMGLSQQIATQHSTTEAAIDKALDTQSQYIKEYADAHWEYLEHLQETNPDLFADARWTKYLTAQGVENLTPDQQKRITELETMAALQAEDAENIDKFKTDFEWTAGSYEATKARIAELEAIKQKANETGVAPTRDGNGTFNIKTLPGGYDSNVTEDDAKQYAQENTGVYAGPWYYWEKLVLERELKKYESELKPMEKKAGKGRTAKEERELQDLYALGKGQVLTPTEQERLNTLQLKKDKGSKWKKGEEAEYNELIERKNSINDRQRFKTRDELRAELYDEEGNINMAGLDFFDQIQNNLTGETFGSWLAQNKGDLFDWSQEYNPWDYTFAGTNKGSFRTMMGMASMDNEYSFVERFGAMTEEQITQTFDRFSGSVSGMALAVSDPKKSKDFVNNVNAFGSELHSLAKELGVDKDFEEETGMSFSQLNTVITKLSEQVKNGGAMNADVASQIISQTLGGVASGAAMGGFIGGMFGGIGAGPGAIIGTVVGGLLGIITGSISAASNKSNQKKANAAIKEQVQGMYNQMLNELTNYAMNKKRTAELEFNKQSRQF